MEVVDWRPEVFRGFVRELIQDIKRHGMDRETDPRADAAGRSAH
jgi:hypothetical protein